MRTHKISWKSITLQQKKILILLLSLMSLLLVFLDKGEVKKYAESSIISEDMFGPNTGELLLSIGIISILITH